MSETAALLQGLDRSRMETPVIDFHCHVGSWGRFWMDDDVELFLRGMDRAGIDQACINCIFQGEARRGNDLVAEFVERPPDRFIGVAFVTPHYPNEMVPELGATLRAAWNQVHQNLPALSLDKDGS